MLAEVWDRVVKAAQGAALGTGTTVDWEVIGGVYELLPNETLGRAMHANLTRVGGVKYTADEKTFAERLGRTLPGGRPAALELAEIIAPFQSNVPPAPVSTDVADISWVAPTMGVGCATWVPGTPYHSWQAVACGGTSIGTKGMVVAAKTLALTAIDLLTTPELIAKAKAELVQRRGSDFKYVPLLGDRKPPLDYRD